MLCCVYGRQWQARFQSSMLCCSKLVNDCRVPFYQQKTNNKPKSFLKKPLKACFLKPILTALTSTGKCRKQRAILNDSGAYLLY